MPRAKRAGDQYEDDLHVRAAAYLRHVLPPDAFWCHIPNQSRGSSQNASASDLWGMKVMAAKLKDMGMRPGMPDLLIWYGGATFGGDFKSVYGKATPEQIAVAAEMNAAGCRILDPVTHPIRTIEDLEDALVGWGIPLAFRYRELKEKNTMTGREANAMSAIEGADKALKARRAARNRRNAGAGASQSGKRKNLLASF
jgi:hypothetical protein